MIVVELDKLDDAGYKKPANSINANAPDYITHARLYYNTFSGNNYIQGSFVNGSNSTVEFDNLGITHVKFKLFTSINGTDYNERKSFGGSEGKDCITEQQLINAAGYTDLDIIVKKTVGGVAQFVPLSISELLDEADVTVEASGVDYLYCRGMLSQHNSVQSGKAFYGSTYVDQSTGVVTESITAPQITIADSFSRSLSYKISTGKYILQFRTDSVNNFVESLAGFFSYRFESVVIPITTKRTVTATDYYNDIDGYIICRSNSNIIDGFGTSFTSDFNIGDLFYIIYGNQTAEVASVDSDTQITLNTTLTGADNPTGVNISGTIATTNGSKNIVGTGTTFTSLIVGQQILSTNATGIITAITDNTHLTIDTNATATASGTSYVYQVTSPVREVNIDYTEYISEITTELIGYLVLDTRSDEGATYYQCGKLLIKTYNTSWVLTDNIIEAGVTFGFKAYPTL